MTEPIEAIVKRHRLGLALLISRCAVEFENTLRILRSMEKDWQTWQEDMKQA